MVIWSPEANSLTTRPSALRMVAGLGLMILTEIVAVSGRINERLDSVCGQIGVRAKTSARWEYDSAAGGK